MNPAFSKNQPRSGMNRRKAMILAYTNSTENGQRDNTARSSEYQASRSLRMAPRSFLG